MMAPNSDEVPPENGISDSSHVKIDVPESSSSRAPGDGREPWTFIKGSTYLGRSISKIRALEGSALSNGATATRNCWKDQGWEKVPRRVENLLWIKENTFYKEVLDDCKEQKKDYAEKIKAERRSQGEVTNEIYNLIGFFSVFQGVILTAVSQLAQANSNSVCGKVWFPVALSVLAVLIAVGGIALKYWRYHAHEVEIHRNRDFDTKIRRRETELKEEGENFFFGGTEKERKKKKDEENTIKSLDLFWPILRAGLVSVLLCLLTTVFILSYFVIMCDMWVIKGW